MDEIYLAPIYDCGSALFPQADAKIMKSVITNLKELMIRVYDRPLSSIKYKGSKIRYFDFISALNNHDCNELKRIVPKIDMCKINTLIDETPFINDLQKTFYKCILKERKERILDFSLNKLLNQEKKEINV